MAIAVTLVDANELFREGLRRLLDEGAFRVVGSADSLGRLPGTAVPDDERHVLLIDPGPAEGAPDILQEAAAAVPGARIVVLADSFAMEHMTGCMQAGAAGYLLKSIGWNSLCASLELVAAGGRAFPPQLADHLASPGGPPRRVAQQEIRQAGGRSLSAREIEILRCLVAGESNKMIARRLDIMETTVKVHIKGILRKLRVANRTQAAIWATDAGLDVPEDPDAAAARDRPRQQPPAPAEAVGRNGLRAHPAMRRFDGASGGGAFPSGG